jgi:hypothetical protein
MEHKPSAGVKARDTGINYPELGGVHEKTVFYPEGATYTHPSGAVYKRIDGNWKLIRYPDGTEAPQ